LGVLDYLKQYSSENTIRSYQSGLKTFFEVVYGKREPLEELAERYFNENRAHEEDVQDFLVHLKGYPPMTVNQKLTSVRVFLVENGVELSQRFWKRLRGRVKGSRAVTIDKVPSNEELRKIMMHLPVQGRALYLALSSSGMRIGEALQTKLDDLDLESNPARVTIQGEYTKTGNPRRAFVSREAKEAIGEWLKVRESYLEAAAAKSHLHGKDASDSRFFPFEAPTAYKMWHNALRKAGLGKRDKRTNHHKIHPHVLRKFFRTRLGAVIPVDVVEALMGHEGYLTEVYRRYSVEDLAKFYKQGEHALLVFTESGEITKLRKEVQEQKDKLQALVNGLAVENMQLKDQMKQQDEKIAEIAEVLAELKRMVKPA